MKRWLWPAVIALLVSAAAGSYAYSVSGNGSNDPPFRLASIDRGNITASVRATGTLTPVSTVLVGSQLSGLIVEILVDFNSQVKAGQVVARLFSDQIRARRDGAAAEMAAADADVGVKRAQLDRARATRLRADSNLRDIAAQRERAVAMLAENRRSLERQSDLFRTGSGSRAVFDAAKTQVEMQSAQLTSVDAQTASAQAEIVGLEADIALANAQVKASEAVRLQRRARLADIEIDLSNTDIRSPVDGVVVQRQIELGQTVAASFSSPTLFTIAEDLRRIEIYSNIDEADVGRIKAGQKVNFTVNAYPNRTFEGAVKVVRLGAQTVQNVVTYTGVIVVDNTDMALLPGMTANLQVITDERQNVLRAPNAALRFKPVNNAALVSGANAQVEEPSPFAQGPGGGAGANRAAQVFRERLVTEVKPTPEQLAAIDSVLEAGRERLRAERQGASPEEIRRNAQLMRRENATKIAQALDPERRARFEKAMADLQAQNRQRQQRETTPGRVHIVGEDGQPKAIDVRLGVTDGAVTEIIGSELQPGANLITGGGPLKAAQPVVVNRARSPRLF
ncbi:MAG: efflux RND transporter periplasmic adaptor subunit [Bosea sp. (in: a-proteobacteria)]